MNNYNLQIELTNKCNLKCVECPNRLMIRPRFHMGDEVFAKTVELFVKDMPVDTVITHKDGEPLLHPKFVEYMRILSEVTDAKIDVYTNGLLFTPELFTALGELKNQFSFLVTYHFYDVGGGLVKYSNVDDMLMYALKLNKPNLNFTLVTHVVDFADINNLNDWRDSWLIKKKEFPHLKDVHVNTAINHWAGRIRQKGNVEFQACPYGDGAHVFVGVTGNIIPCCMDLDEELSTFGNVMDQDFSVNVSRAYLADFYHKLNHRLAYRELCRKCVISPLPEM